MATRLIVVRRDDTLVPVDAASIDALRKMPTNRELGADVVQPRNIQLHRKAFALAQLAFSYWEPESFVSATEKRTVGSLGKFLVDHGLPRDTVRELCVSFLRHLNARRETVEAEKSFEGFREFITVEAGHYSVIMTPSGPRKTAKSWSFASMEEGEFREFYRDLFNACWHLVLAQKFESMEDAEAAAGQLLTFD